VQLLDPGRDLLVVVPGRRLLLGAELPEVVLL
jgi:hypothetical protein